MKNYMWLFTSFALFTCALEGQGAQNPGNKDAAQTQAIKDAASKGFPMQSAATVRDNVSVEAVLLPYSICKRIFGTEIANNYTAVEVTVSNRSADAAMIVHSLYIDYSKWLLSGTPEALAAGGRACAGGTPPGPAPIASAADKTVGLETFQSSTKPGQVASVESRIARGELLDAQNWTIRNWVIRALETAGAIASGYQFVFKEQGLIRGIGAFNGQVIPASQILWPDGTIGQLNRISDYGFQANKVIPKQSADIMVGFFPIDRFLTPGLKKIFRKAPAAFFVPGSLFADPQSPAVSWMAESLRLWRPTRWGSSLCRW